MFPCWNLPQVNVHCAGILAHAGWPAPLKLSGTSVTLWQEMMKDGRYLCPSVTMGEEEMMKDVRYLCPSLTLGQEEMVKDVRYLCVRATLRHQRWQKMSGTCACERLPCSSPQLMPSKPSTMCILWACTLVCRNTMHLSQNVRLTSAATHNGTGLTSAATQYKAWMTSFLTQHTAWWSSAATEHKTCVRPAL